MLAGIGASLVAALRALGVLAAAGIF